MLEVFENDSVRRILHVMRRDVVPSVDLRRRLCLTGLPALHVQREHRGFGHVSRRPDGGLPLDLLLPTPRRTLRRRAGGQLTTLTNMIKADLEPLSRPRMMEEGLGESRG